VENSERDGNTRIFLQGLTNILRRKHPQKRPLENGRVQSTANLNSIVYKLSGSSEKIF